MIKQQLLTTKQQMFASVKRAFDDAELRGIREQIIAEMLNRGHAYDDFVVCRRPPEGGAVGERALTLRSVRNPVPRDVYRTLVSAFNDLCPSNYRNEITMAPVRLVCESRGIVTLDLPAIEGNCLLAARFDDLNHQVALIADELNHWQRFHDDDTQIFGCWPGYEPGQDLPQIFITIAPRFSGPPMGDPAALRERIRRIPEYSM